MPNPFYTYILNIFNLVCLGFMAYQPLLVIQCKILFIHIFWIYMIWFSFVLWPFNHCRLFKSNFFLYVYIKYIRFGYVGFYGIWTIAGFFIQSFWYIYILYICFASVSFYGISTIVDYSMPNPLYTLISNMSKLYDLRKHFVDNIFKRAWTFFFFLLTVKWFLVLLCISSNSIKHHSFRYTQFTMLKQFYFKQFSLA